MTTKTGYILTGVFVIVLTMALIWGTLWLSAGGAPGEFDYYLTYMKESVSGLSPDSALTYRGVSVGKVRDITIDPNDPEQVRLLLQVQRGVPITEDTEATLNLQGLTGLATIDLSGGTRDSPRLVAKPGQAYPIIPSRPSLLVRLDSVISDLIGNLITMSDKLNRVLDEPTQRNVSGIVAHIEVITGTLAAQSGRLESIIADAEATVANTRAASGALPDLMRDVRQSTDALAAMANELRAAGTTINDTAQSLQETARASGNDVQRFTSTTLPDISALTDDLRGTAENLRHLSDTIERDPSVLLYGRPARKRGPGE
jgi:phospholipid/cholesterol/gamma-HCH transport system substrate-binding protein